jgi:hypothetical protein
MAQDRHAPEYRKNDFCARVPCEDNDYIKICDPGWPNENRWKFAQKTRGGKAGLRNYEAHHILCWSPVAKVFFEDEVTKEIIEGTKWCVNNKANMVALPLWGHTVQWYSASDGPPPFANLPQHDRDHNCKGGYTSEVLDELVAFANKLKKAKEAHKLPPPEKIAGSLNTKSHVFRGNLALRGIRPPGTHIAFTDGEKFPLWYLPFSMAVDGIAKPRRCMRSKKAKWDAIKAAQKLLSGA